MSIPNTQSSYPPWRPNSLFLSEETFTKLISTEIFECKSVQKQAISRIYELLSMYDSTPLNSLKNKWEEDLDELISEEVWHKIIQGIFTSSICLRHAVIQFKIVHRLHWSKVKLSKIKANIDSTFDRCRQVPATLLHMFWTNIFETFSGLFGEVVESSPFNALFGVAHEKNSFTKVK